MLGARHPQTSSFVSVSPGQTFSSARTTLCTVRQLMETQVLIIVLERNALFQRKLPDLERPPQSQFAVVHNTQWNASRFCHLAHFNRKWVVLQGILVSVKRRTTNLTINLPCCKTHQSALTSWRDKKIKKKKKQQEQLSPKGHFSVLFLNFPVVLPLKHSFNHQNGLLTKPDTLTFLPRATH